MMGFPVFLFLIVLEKEKRLLEMMKINGLKISNYWTMQFFFNYVLYMITAVVFTFFGCYVFKFMYFVHTSMLLQFLILNGWGLVQISTAFFFSVFMKKSSTANILGYGMAIYSMVIAQVVNLLIFPIPASMPWYYHFIPSFTFSRAMLHVSQNCIFYTCYTSLDRIEIGEAKLSVIMLYV